MRAKGLLSRLGPWLLVAGSTAGLAGLILTTWPSPLMRLVFLSLLFLGSFGLVSLVLRAHYSQRMPDNIRRRDPQRVTREGLMVAGFVTLCAWLQMLQILTLTNALLLLGVLAFTEAFWISRNG